MNVVIIGCGKLGFAIAKRLTEEKHNIVIIDIKEDFREKVQESIDVLWIKGNGLSQKVLSEAEVDTANIVIATTTRDETNILCCLIAKRLGAMYTVARVRDPGISSEMSFLKTDLGLDVIVNPEYQAALEISRLLRFPTANDIETFSNGKLEMVSFRVNEKDPFVGNKLTDLFTKINAPILFGIVERGGDVIIPHGDYTFGVGDIVRVFGKPADVTHFFKVMGKYQARIKNAMIVGGGRIAFYLSTIMNKGSIKLKIIEIDEKRCMELSEAFPENTIINADGSDEELLRYENIEEVDALVALTNMDEENLFISLFAMQCEVPKVISKINKINMRLMSTLGLDSVICPKNIAAAELQRYVSGKTLALGNSVETLYRINAGDSEVDVLEFILNERIPELNKPLSSLRRLKKSVLIGAITRNGKVFIPQGKDHLQLGDTVVVISKDSDITDIENIFE